MSIALTDIGHLSSSRGAACLIDGAWGASTFEKCALKPRPCTLEGLHRFSLSLRERVRSEGEGNVLQSAFLLTPTAYFFTKYSVATCLANVVAICSSVLLNKITASLSSGNR
jgi:hypothetical protein